MNVKLIIIWLYEININVIKYIYVYLKHLNHSMHGFLILKYYSSIYAVRFNLITIYLFEKIDKRLIKIAKYII